MHCDRYTYFKIVEASAGSVASSSTLNSLKCTQNELAEITATSSIATSSAHDLHFAYLASIRRSPRLRSALGPALGWADRHREFMRRCHVAAAKSSVRLDAGGSSISWITAAIRRYFAKVLRAVGVQLPPKIKCTRAGQG